MIIFIYVSILALNIVAIFLTYRFLGKKMDNKSKGIFIIVGIAIIYMLVSFVYWVATKNIDLGTDDSFGKNLITFTFVPVNAIVILPFLASSYKNLKDGKLKTEPFRNRCILLAVILVSLLVWECFYFKDIQIGIYNIFQNAKNNTTQNMTNDIESNSNQDTMNNAENSNVENSVNNNSNQNTTDDNVNNVNYDTTGNAQNDNTQNMTGNVQNENSQNTGNVQNMMVIY